MDVRGRGGPASLCGICQDSARAGAARARRILSPEARLPRSGERHRYADGRWRDVQISARASDQGAAGRADPDLATKKLERVSLRSSQQVHLSPQEGFAYWADWHWYAGKLFFLYASGPGLRLVPS